MNIRRIWSEWRPWWIVLALLLVANVAVYALGVRPLASRVAADQDRGTLLAAQLLEARRSHEDAQAMERADEQTRGAVEDFYRDALPRGLDGAREMTYLRVAQMVGEHGLRYSRRRHVPDDATPSAALGRLRTTMVLEGDYERIRQFIYALEVAPELIVIDEIALSEGTDSGAPLTLTVGLSTYYRRGPAREGAE